MLLGEKLIPTSKKMKEAYFPCIQQTVGVAINNVLCPTTFGIFL